MTRVQLVARIWASNPHLYQRDAEAAVTTILDRIAAALATGGRVELRDFGTFTLRQMKAREGRNPRTRVRVDVPAKADVRFKPGKGMRTRLNLEPEPMALAAE